MAAVQYSGIIVLPGNELAIDVIFVNDRTILLGRSKPFCMAG